MLVKLGNWLFHYRNILFPVFYAMLFVPSAPIFENKTVAVIIGSILIAMGITVRAATIGFEYIERGGKDRKIHASKLVTEGIYTLCRNPMYLGNILILVGFGFFANSLLFVLVFFPLFILFYVAIIKAEEEFLGNKFGEEYRRYKKKVNSLIPDLRKTKSALKHNTFHWINVIIKEYNSLFLYFSGILLLLMSKGFISAFAFSILFVMLLTNYLTVKMLKRRGVLKAY